MKTTRSLSVAVLALALLAGLPGLAFAAATDAKVALGGMRADGHVDRFIVRYRDGSAERRDTSIAGQSFAAALSRSAGSRARASAPLTARALQRLAVGGTVFRVSRKLGASEATALMKAIAADPAVVHVEPDVLLHAVRDVRATDAASPPDDPNYTVAQWNFFDPTGGANLPGVWNAFPGVDGSGVTVAVIDTGVTAHEDLDTSLADAGYDFIVDPFVSGRATEGRVPGGWDIGDWTTDEPWLSECTSDDHPAEFSSWHGTNVAGIVSELTNNGIGMAGAAPGAKVLPIRALGHCGGYTSDIADAIVWAAGGHVDGVPDNTHPASVINLSLGGSGPCEYDGVTSAAVADALARGATVVVAAGNAADDAGNYTPASCPGVVSVGATGITGRRAFYSNFGSTVTLSAPGGGIYPNDGFGGSPSVPNGFIWAAYNYGTTTPVSVADGGSVYAGMAGTSQATPHVSATVALMLDATRLAGLPSPSPAAIRTMLASSARPFPLTIDRPMGSGILDAQGAVAAALGVTLPPQVVALAQGRLSPPQQRAAGSSALLSIEVPAGARNLVIRSVGGTGDASLFVKAGALPAEDGSDAGYRSVRPGNTESVVVPAPAAGTWYIRLAAVKDFANVNVVATFVLP
ncbi:S8 family serine peptidase [Luteibacter sp. 329MFSha]|uniref:S8 family serine peptidase n=1 Tax=Luteibacter sp. 329MFSha TaxID=1798239 RepID=UPI0008CC6ABE|nr:S8 family serine peptidase [Luteibacter sp. 329MFSha]SEW19517.1 serine protease [Luteibacter sp. 329MFSha]